MRIVASRRPSTFPVRVRTEWHLVGHVPSEIDLSRNEFAVAHCVHFAVAETFASRRLYFIHNERASSLLELVNIFEAHYHGAIRPADSEIGCAIECVVYWACEMEVVVDERFD